MIFHKIFGLSSIHKNNYSRIIFVVSLHFFFYATYAQQSPFFVTSYLPDKTGASRINHLADQMGNGEMIFANIYGLLKFDGVKWKLYSFKDKEKRHIQFTQILPLGDKIYIGSTNNFGYLKKKQKDYFFTSLKADNSKKSEFNYITQIIKYKDKIFFASRRKIFVTNGEKVIKIIDAEKEKLFAYLFNLNNKKLLLSQSGVGLLEWQKGAFTVSNQASVFRKKLITLVSNTSLGKIIIFYKNGIWLQKKEQDGIKKLCFGKEIDSLLSKENVFCATMYNDQSVMLGTGSGKVYILDIKKRKIQEIFSGESYIKDIFIDKNRNVWLINHDQILYIEVNSPFRSFLKGIDIKDILPTKNGLFISTTSKKNSLFWLKKRQQKPIALISATQRAILCRMNDEAFLVASSQGVYSVNYLKNDTQKLSSIKGVFLMYKDSFMENIYYISTNHALYIFEYRNNKLTKLKQIDNSLGGIVSILRTKRHLWLGSVRSGIIRYTFDLKNPLKTMGKKYYGTSNGYFQGDDNESRIREVNGEIWINNSSGIYQYNEKQDSFTKININTLNTNEKTLYTSNISLTKDGLFICGQNNKFSHFGVAEKISQKHYTWYDIPFKRLPNYEIRKLITHNNVLYTATSKGLLSYDPNKKKNYAVSYPALIQRITTSSDTLFENKSTLPYQQNQLTFEYSAPFYEVPEKTTFSYKLIGFDKNWSNWSTEYKKEYTNLPEGTYTFQVKAKNVYGRESKVATYSFTILPPWYRTWWAYTLYILGAIGLLVSGSIGYSRFRNRQIRRHNQELEQVVTARTEEIRAQKEEITQQASALKVTNEKLKTTNETLERTNETLGTTNEALAQANERIQKEKKLYLQETAEATSKLQEIRQMLASQGAATVDKMLGKEIKAASEFIIIRDKVRKAFPDFAERIDQARTDEDKNITPLMWQIAHCFKLGLTPVEVADILPTTSRSASSQGSALRRMGLLPPAKKFTRNKS